LTPRQPSAAGGHSVGRDHPRFGRVSSLRPLGVGILRDLRRGQGLLRHQFAVEGGVLGEVPDEQVPAGARDGHRVAGRRGLADRRRVEAIGQPLVQSLDRAEAVELLRVARRLRVCPRDDVAAVRPVFARGADELPSARQCRRQVVPQRRRGLAGEAVLAVGEGENQFVVRGRLSADRFLDQPPADGFLYPRRMSGGTSCAEVGRPPTYP
jgi:hypothetical protein